MVQPGGVQIDPQQAVDEYEKADQICSAKNTVLQGKQRKPLE